VRHIHGRHGLAHREAGHQEAEPVNRVPRSRRRVLLVLLSGAPELGGYTIARAAMTGYGKVYVILDHLERLGWVESDWESPEPLNRPRRRFYRLTGEGRMRALAALGLRASQEAAQ
jgi:PadR family transcriptional regulator PadR